MEFFLLLCLVATATSERTGQSDGSTNIALLKPAYQSSVSFDGEPARAVDGSTGGVYDKGTCTHTAVHGEDSPWWYVDLQETFEIGRVAIFNRIDCCPERINPFNLHIGDSSDVTTNPKVGGDWSFSSEQGQQLVIHVNGTKGRYVGISAPGSYRFLTLCEVQVFEVQRDIVANLALRQPTSQSSLDWSGPSGLAVDGGRSGSYDDGSCTHTATEDNPWWYVDLGGTQEVDHITIFNRVDHSPDRINYFNLHIGDNSDVTANQKIGGDWTFAPGEAEKTIQVSGTKGRYVGIILPGSNRILTLCEVEVYGVWRCPDVLPTPVTEDHQCPDVDRTLTPWNPGHDPTAQVVVGGGQSFLLQSSATFYSLEIKDGGRVVFADMGSTSDYEIFLRARDVTVGDGGELHIGSETCPYQGKATVSLYGRSDDNVNSTKQFLVTSGGTLEIHGQRKVAWTQLTQTVPQGGLPKGPYWWDSLRNTWHRGINVRVIDEITAAVVDSATFDTSLNEENSRSLATFIDLVPSGRIVALAVQQHASLEASAKEKLRELGSVEVDSLGAWEPWAFVGVKGKPGTAVEQRLPHIDAQSTGTANVTATFQAFFGDFDVIATSAWVGGSARSTFSVGRHDDGYVINLKDDVSSWLPGDRIVMASTDYNMEQAEEFQLLPCQECSSHQVKISGDIRYMHFGEISDEVDLRGEVGLLTRNIKFQGEVEDGCYGDNKCQFFDFDTYGGHLKILRGFKNVHLSGIEFTRMGQQILGRYPVHFHMTGDVDEKGCYSRPTYVRELSIHHCFSRCVTIHGTHGLLVQDTVGYETLGHCYFLEDGAEQRNVLDHNLGMSTRYGTQLPTDRDENMCRNILDGVYGDYTPNVYADCMMLSTFWISHPNNDLINNAAAGTPGIGIWYLFHLEPSGLSAGALPPLQSSFAPMGRFYNNRAHSNAQGLLIEGGVKTTPSTASSPAEFLAKLGGRYKPHQNSDLLQPRVPAMLEGYTAFKNHVWGAWVRGGDVWIDKSAFADNAIGLVMASEGIFPGDVGSTQQVWNSIFIGESENVGTKTGSMHWGMGSVKQVERSWPHSTETNLRGIDIYDGPIFVDSCTFKRYAKLPEADRWSSAIGFRAMNVWQNTPKNNFTRSKFENVESRIFMGAAGLSGFGEHNLDGDKTNILHDMDGSLTGYPDSYLVGPDNYLVRNPGCVEKPDWIGLVCRGEYASLFINTNHQRNRMSMYRDEYPDNPVTLETPFTTTYYMPVVMLDKSYTVHWDGKAPEEINVYPINFDSGDWVRVGFCYPPGTNFKVTYQLRTQVPWAIVYEEDVSSVSSLAEIDGGDGKLYYFEESTSLLFLKVRANYDREGHDYCSHMGCERIVISATMTSDVVSDCTATAYPKYSLTPTETVPSPTFMSMVNDCTGCGAPEPIVFDEGKTFVEVTVVSSGSREMLHGHGSFVQIDGVQFDSHHHGHLVISVDAVSGSVTHEMTFHSGAELAMATFIRHIIPQNSIVLVAASDASSLIVNSQECLSALKQLGAQELDNINVGGTFAMVGFKGTFWPSWIQHVNLPSGQGPAQIYTKIPLMG
ncbi:cell surface hyaluronidase-like [Branchiostoma floridae]|uniref:hyaluronoglucosaminidase n=1 Tax=Branchiostoma floridae TaxID=7739 RepID=A0A9J7L428_BRAFL|nr:cell surface hyaluronidase-like [Branchiostoma floridae]